MFQFRRPSAQQLERVLAASIAAAPTFEPVGATQSATRVSGFRFDTYSGIIGHGARDWPAARHGLKVWAAHTGAGASLTPDDAPVAENQTIVVTTRVGLLHVLVPCRVAYVVDEPNRFGFAYVTLPGHPECGEEAFMLTRGDDDLITFTMSSHSHPAELLARLGGPVSRVVQRHTNLAYIAGLRRFVEQTRG
jgi:uncharacterized protein (UPF0548 family)